MKNTLGIILAATLSIFCFPASGESEGEKTMPHGIVFEDGKALVHIKSALDSNPKLNVEFEGIASSTSGEKIAASEDQEYALHARITGRLRKMDLHEFHKKSIKDDMRIVFEEDIREILKSNIEINIIIIKLILTSGDLDKNS